MKNLTNMNLVFRSAMALTLALWFPVHAQSADAAEGTMMKPGKMMECCQAMKGHKEKMMAEMKAQDTELAKQVAEMNSAPADRKLDLLAAIVTRMVEYRAAMQSQMEQMHMEMMEDMPMGKEGMKTDHHESASTEAGEKEE